MAAYKCASRVRFMIAEDISLLREVQTANPFRDAAQWTLGAVNVSAATNKSLTVHVARDRCDLLPCCLCSTPVQTGQTYANKSHVVQDVRLNSHYALVGNRRRIQRKRAHLARTAGAGERMLLQGEEAAAAGGSRWVWHGVRAQRVMLAVLRLQHICQRRKILRRSTT